MVASWVSYWVYSIGNDFINEIMGYGSGKHVYARIFGIFLAGVFVVFPTYKLTKKYL